MEESSNRQRGENDEGTPVLPKEEDDDDSGSDSSIEAVAEDLPALWYEQLFLVKDRIVELKLEGFKLNLPESIDFPCLRRLSLTQAALCDNWSDDPWTRLLSNCPVLKYLSIKLCEGVEKLSVCSTSLTRLRVALKKDLKLTIVIETPNLQVLCLSTGIVQSRVSDLPSLTNTELDIRTSRETWIDLLQRICSTKTLYLYHTYLDGPTASLRLPIFQKLTRMEVAFTYWSIALPIIRHAPNLVSLITHAFVFDWPDRNPGLTNIPLERIEYHGFDGHESLEVLKYFVGHSAILKKVIIYLRSSLDYTAELNILKKLLKLHRASSQCRIIVVYENEGYNSDDSVNGDGEQQELAEVAGI